MSVTLSRSIELSFSRRIRGSIILFLLLFMAIPALLFTAVNADAAGQVTLGWNACASSSVTGYKVYYGTASGNYAYYVDAGNTTSTTVTGLSAGATYYFAATAYDSSGDQSAASNQVSYTVPSGSGSGSGSGSCTYSISPASASVGAGATTGNISVTTQSGCTWTATSGASWMTITSGSSGTGSGIVSCSVAGNTSTSSRTMNSTIAGVSFSLTQAAGSGQGTGTGTGTPPTQTTYTITASAGAGGSISPSGSVSVNSGASKSFSITPIHGYSISNVTVDGKSMGRLSSYTFSNVKATHTIGATFSSRYAW